MASKSTIQDLFDSSLPPGGLNQQALEAAKKEIEALQSKAHRSEITQGELRDQISAILEKAMGPHQEGTQESGRERIHKNQLVHLGSLLERMLLERTDGKQLVSSVDLADELDKTMRTIASVSGTKPEDLLTRSFATVDRSKRKAYDAFSTLEVGHYNLQEIRQRRDEFCRVAQGILSDRGLNVPMEEHYDTPSHQVYLANLKYVQTTGEKPEKIMTLEATTVPKKEISERHGSDAVTGLYLVTINLTKGTIMADNLMMEYGKNITPDELRSIADAILRTFTGRDLENNDVVDVKSKGKGQPIIPHLRRHKDGQILAIGHTVIGELLREHLVGNSRSVSGVQSFRDFIGGLNAVNDLLFQHGRDASGALDLQGLPAALELKDNKRYKKEEREGYLHAAELVRLYTTVGHLEEVMSALRPGVKISFSELLEQAARQHPELAPLANNIRGAA